MQKSLQLLGRLFKKKKKKRNIVKPQIAGAHPSLPARTVVLVPAAAACARCGFSAGPVNAATDSQGGGKVGDCACQPRPSAGGPGKPRWRRRNGRREGSVRRAAAPRVATATARGPAMAEEGSIEDGVVAEIEKKITEAFEVFDHEGNETVDVREIGSIVRSLGCFPTEAELHELLAKVEEEEPTGYVHLEKFLPVMTKVLLDRSYRPIPEDVLLHAFEALDENKSGYITKEELVKHMTEEGEPFTEEEMEEMLSSALDPETNAVHYRDYISMMIVDETDDLPQ
uniref:EF-hand calcium binding domain 2 n=1 Tax=Pavo cristatus TaxID=9049 RepID=A0A8C9LB60_PAVCR